MVGSDRGKEAMAMMALHEALRNVCINSDWTYSVFWTIRPRPRSRGGSGCKVGDENGSLMLMWEDGYCRPTKPTTPRMNRMHQGPFNGGGMSKSPSFDCLDEMDADDPVRKAFRKMSIQLYNYGEGLMGKVASDKCHKWVFKEPNECEPGISNYWQSSFDAHPPEWTDQFASGIQTIVVIQAGHGLLQLGSCKIIPEDLHFVLRMRHAFDSLGYQSGYYLSQLFSGGRNPPQPPSSLLPQPKPALSPRPPIYNWSQRPTLPTFAPLRPQDTPQHHFLLQTNNNSTQNGSNSDTMVVPSPSEMLQEAASEIKWPNGLSYLTALTARADDKHLFFGPDAGGGFAEHHHHSMQNSPSSSSPNMLSKFKRSLTLPARMPQSPNSSPHLHHMDTQNHHDLNSPHTSQHNNNNGMDYSMSPHHQHQSNHASTTATTSSSIYADMINMDSFLE